MKRTILALLFAAALVATLAAPVLAADTLPKPGNFDEEEILTSEHLARYDTVVVKDFTTKGADIVNMDAEEQKNLEAAKAKIVRALTESTVENLKKDGKFKTVLSNAKASGNAIVLEGKFYQFNGGIGAAKFFLGWMAPKSGKTNIGIEAQLVDAKSGKVLARFKDIRSGGEGATLGSGHMARAFEIQAKDEGEEIADFIGKLY